MSFLTNIHKTSLSSLRLCRWRWLRRSCENGGQWIRCFFGTRAKKWIVISLLVFRYKIHPNCIPHFRPNTSCPLSKWWKFHLNLKIIFWSFVPHLNSRRGRLSGSASVTSTTSHATPRRFVSRSSFIDGAKFRVGLFTPSLPPWLCILVLRRARFAPN